MIKHSETYTQVFDKVIATTPIILDIKVLSPCVLLIIIHGQDEVVDDIAAEEGVGAKIHYAVVSPPQVVVLCRPELLGFLVQ